ncbi:MAG: hypothetical protein AB7E47_17815 [Desulfovibrionaceae bacterium]
MDCTPFFTAHSVFTREMFEAFAAGGQPRSRKAVEAMLGAFKRAGRIVGVRRGVYVSVPPDAKPRAVAPHPLLVAACIAPDAVIAYGTAADVHAALAAPRAANPATVAATAIGPECAFLTNSRPRPTTFQGVRYLGFGFPVALRDKRMETHGVARLDMGGIPATGGGPGQGGLLATSPERTLVDILDRPGVCGGFEAAWSRLAALPVADWDGVLAYVRLLGNATTAAKVGFHLAASQARRRVPVGLLDALRAMVPVRPHYAERTRRHAGRLVKPWNLVVPTAFLDAHSL